MGKTVGFLHRSEGWCPGPGQALPYSIQPCAVLVPPEQHVTDSLVDGSRQGRVILHDRPGARTGTCQQIVVLLGVEKSECRHAVLTRAEEIAHSAKPQIRPRDLESVLGFHEDLETGRGFGPAVRHQDTEALLRSPAHSTPKLVELRKAEPLGVLHYHHGGIGDVD